MYRLQGVIGMWEGRGKWLFCKSTKADKEKGKHNRQVKRDRYVWMN